MSSEAVLEGWRTQESGPERAMLLHPCRLPVSSLWRLIPEGRFCWKPEYAGMKVREAVWSPDPGLA